MAYLSRDQLAIPGIPRLGASSREPIAVAGESLDESIDDEPMKRAGSLRAVWPGRAESPYGHRLRRVPHNR